MKILAVLLAVALGLAAPALADPGKRDQPVQVQPADAAAADPNASMIDETALNDATTPEARRALLIRCSGPPPRPVPVARLPTPKAEPADISLDPNVR